VNLIPTSFKLIVYLISIFIVTGCGTKHVKPKPIQVNLFIQASAKLNPDMANRASPIVLRVYQLTQIDSFNNNSDFFSLYEKDQSLLAKDLTFREELEIKPNQSSVKPLNIDPSSHYVAVLAAFRNLDKAQWKAFLKINPSKPPPLTIKLDEFKVNIQSN
jgi:type VI secretion system protein VasD